MKHCSASRHVISSPVTKSSTSCSISASLCTALVNLMLFDTLFTADAHLDYTANPGGVKGSLTEVKAWLMQSLLAFPTSQHLLSNTEIVLDGDRAAARTQMTNPMGVERVVPAV